MFLKGKWATDTFVTNYLPLALFPILYIGAKLYFRTPMVRPEDMDFITGLAEIEAETYDEPPPRNWVEKWWQWLVRPLPSLRYAYAQALNDCLSADVKNGSVFCPPRNAYDSVMRGPHFYVPPWSITPCCSARCLLYCRCSIRNCIMITRLTAGSLF